MNFFSKMVAALADANKNSDDVLWVGSRDGAYSITWDAFRDNNHLHGLQVDESKFVYRTPTDVTGK